MSPDSIKMDESSKEPTIFFHDIPSDASVTFHESSFFTRQNNSQKQTSLPKLAEVLAEGAKQKPEPRLHVKKHPAYFKSLGLAVKYGDRKRVSIEEGQCLWALRHHLPTLPVPEIYGWWSEDRQDGYVLLYIELIDGDTVEKRWDSMKTEERRTFWRSLQSMYQQLRSLRPDPQSSFLGTISRGPYYDRSIPTRPTSLYTSDLPPAGPFPSVKAFHDWISFMVMYSPPGGKKPEEEEMLPEDPYRRLLPDDAEIAFTHGDLHPSNIMVDARCPSRIVSLIDWEQSGWFPDYWEFCKAEWTAEYGSEWHRYMVEYLGEPAEDAIVGFHDYNRALGCY